MPTGYYDRTHLRKSLVGNDIGYAHIIALDHRTKGRNFWKCVCTYNGCGNHFVRSQQNLIKHKEDANCGCYSRIKGNIAFQRYCNKDNNIRRLPHGLRIYEIHHGMMSRCNNPNNRSFNDYGGRGIKVCEEWANDRKAFYEWALSHGYSDDLTLDRIDVNGNYCPENCRWSNITTQNNNQRNTIKYEYKGKYYTVAELAREVDIDEGTLAHRIARGLSIEDACRKYNEQNGKMIKGYTKRKMAGE